MAELQKKKLSDDFLQSLPARPQQTETEEAVPVKGKKVKAAKKTHRTYESDEDETQDFIPLNK